MIIQDPNYCNGIPDLLHATTEELMELWKTLPAPELEEMNGEYLAQLIGQRSWMDMTVWRMECENPLIHGSWIGKAFRPVDETFGRGYNMFRERNGEIVQVFPMKTLIAPSRFDGKPAYTLVYSAYRSANRFVHMVDEVRKLGEGHYLLIGTYGLTKKQRMKPDFNLLIGPQRPYTQDIGEEMPFDWKEEIPNYGTTTK